jgi:Protein of unknown function (DUF2892)
MTPISTIAPCVSDPCISFIQFVQHSLNRKAMKINMGMGDRVIRVIVAGLLVAGSFSNVIPGAWGYVALGVAGIFALTGLIGTCPIYSVLGASTCSTKSESHTNS